MSYNALQILIRSIHFDRRTRRSMWGYVIGLVQRNSDGASQLFISDGSFRVRRDNDPKTRVDEIFRYDGDGKLIFSTPADGLDLINISLFFIRDRSRMRDFGTLLQNVFSEDKLGTKIAGQIATGLATSNPVGAAVFQLAPEVAQYVASLLKARRDNVLIRAEGTLRVTTIEDLVERDMDDAMTWGDNTSDKGFFTIDVDLVTMNNPEAPVTFVSVPTELRRQIGGMTHTPAAVAE